MCHCNRLGKLTFIFILYFLAIKYVSSQTDSYTIGIQRNKSGTTSKWSKNKLNYDTCGGTFRDKQVIISSPRYPNSYSKNLNCEYVFYSPFVCTNEFHIQFLHFDLEPSLNCFKDKVFIGPNEVLCGQVVGIMKYKATNGTFRIKFISDNTIENKGFEMLVTRLPCTERDLKNDSKESSTRNVLSLSEQYIVPVTNNYKFHPVAKQNNIFSTNSPATVTVSNSNSESSYPGTSIVKPICLSQSRPNHNNFTPNLPGCCVNVYNQQKFYLISPGFGSEPQFYSDCLYFIERHHSNVCRLRIEFKYFLLGGGQQRQCTHSFLEIDGRRFCGCKTGSTYYTQWGQSPKSIRFVNVPGFGEIQGFLLEITQELCPNRSVDLLSAKYIDTFEQLPLNNHFIHKSDPRRCSQNYISWLNINTNKELLSKSICVRNSS
ncbi:CUB and sushi domain-containing protein 2 [Contarinia nasturtii]|uniref:CUB and sushi domain-containing protein 2 n=1 Tax=Contarinia nasturtii TaxID=265458 RepID=UPI0012D3D763|nr:CUB and sushi domain-containing protein 2 [Contarinia nasturtii]